MMAEPASTNQNDGTSFTDLPVGEILRRTRVHYKQSVEDIERALRIRASQIKAIETGDLEQLPGRVYAVGCGLDLPRARAALPARCELIA